MALEHCRDQVGVARYSSLRSKYADDAWVRLLAIVRRRFHPLALSPTGCHANSAAKQLSVRTNKTGLLNIGFPEP